MILSQAAMSGFFVLHYHSKVCLLQPCAMQLQVCARRQSPGYTARLLRLHIISGTSVTTCSSAVLLKGLMYLMQLAYW